MKIWRLTTLIFPICLHGFIAGLEFEPCPQPLKDYPCNMTCKIPDFSQLIKINCDGTTRGSCTVFGCDLNMIPEGGNTVHLVIPSLSYTDNCEWSCSYQSNTSQVSIVTVHSGILGLNLTGQKDADGIKLIGTAECLYPSNPTIIIQYKEEGGIYVDLTGQQVYLQSSHISGACGFDIENRTTAISDVSGQHTELKGKSVYFRMGFSQYDPDFIFSSDVGPFSFVGLTTLSSTNSSDMSTVSEPQSTINSDMPTTVSELITIISSSILAVVVVTLLIVLVVKQCRQKNRETSAKNKENCFTTKQGNFTKKDALKSSIEPRKGKTNTKQESISLDKFKHTQLNNSEAPKDRMYKHYPLTTDYMYLNNSGNHGNQHDFNHSHTERNMFKYGNQHNRYPKSHSGPNNRIGYQSPYPEHPGHNEEMFQFYRADKLYQGQQMYQGPYVAQYDHHIKIKPENKRRYEGRTYERNWDFLY